MKGRGDRYQTVGAGWAGDVDEYSVRLQTRQGPGAMSRGWDFIRSHGSTQAEKLTEEDNLPQRVL